MQYSPYTNPKTSYYAPFSGVFNDAQSASDFRKDALRFIRKPYRPPEGDLTIQEVVINRQDNVKRIYDAMICSDMAKDNPGSIAMRRWVNSDFYPSSLVEAYAHKVFDCLIDQVQNGFRGWQHNNYASDDRKGEPEDKNVSCAERLGNIVKAIEEEKTICEDIMTSSCQIRMFVNAPRTYARRKEANRHGNSKRRKTTETTISRVTKLRRPNPTTPISSRHLISSDASPQTGRHFLVDNETRRQNIAREPHGLTPKTQLVPNSMNNTKQGLATDMTCLDTEIIPDFIISGHQNDSRSHMQTHANNPCFNSAYLPHLPSYQSPPPTLASVPATTYEPIIMDNTFSCSRLPGDSFSGPMFEEGNIVFDADLLHIADTEGAVGICSQMPNGASYGLPKLVHPSEINIDPSLEGLQRS